MITKYATYLVGICLFLPALCFAQPVIIENHRSQVLLNPDFSDRQYSAEKAPNSDLSGTGGAKTGAGVAIGDVADSYTASAGSGITLTCSKTVEDYQTIVASGAGVANLSDLSYTTAVSAGKYYRALFGCIGVVGETQWIMRDSDNSWNVTIRNITSDGLYLYEWISPETTGIAFRVSFNDNEQITIYLLSVVEVTNATNWTSNATIDANNYIKWGSGGTVQMVSNATRNTGVVQSGLENGLYSYYVYVHQISVDGIQITADGNKMPLSLGHNWGEIEVVDNTISIRRKAGGCNAIFGPFYMYKVNKSFNYSDRMRIYP